MKKIKLLALLLVAMASVQVQAQDNEENGHKLPPYYFVGLQGGVQNTFNKNFNNGKTFTPTASISFGRYFNSKVGARIHLNGIWNKSGVNYLVGDDGHYRYNYVTGNIDALMNLCTIFGKKNWYPVNVFFVAGLGANCAFENAGKCESVAPGSTMIYADNDSRWAFNTRLGLGLEVPIVRWLSFTLEGDLNARAIGKKAVFNDDVLQMTAQAGLNFKFGYKKNKPSTNEETSLVVESRDFSSFQSQFGEVAMKQTRENWRDNFATPEELEENGHKLAPYYFIGLQGGVQNTFNKEFNNWKTFTPTASISFGRFFNPKVGARIHFNGIWDKSGVNYLVGDDGHYRYNYVTGNIDALMNLCTIFGKKKWYPVNVIFIAGLGANYAFENAGKCESVAPGSTMIYADNDNRWAFNTRLGLGLEVPIARWLSFTLEGDLNARAIGKKAVFNDDILQMTAQAGFNFKFGYKKNKSAVSAGVVPPVLDTRNLSLYGQMQNTVNERMKNWAKRLDGESQADFLARTSEEAMQAQRLEFTKQVSTEMADNRANKTRSSFKYNTAAQQLGVDFADMPSIALSVPKSDVKEINKSGLQFTNTVYGLNPDDSFEVLYTEALNPATGKTYTFVKQRQAQSVGSANYVPLSAVLEDMENSQRLQAVATNAVQEAKDKNILSDNTNIYVKTQMIPASNGKTDYKVSYTYTVKDNFSVQDDFAPGKYEAEKSAASTAMLKIINQTISEDFAKYIKDGKTVDINFKGSADASPIHGKIAYNNQYGPINNCKVKVNGTNQNMTVTKATGITSNEQLSLVRAISVKNYILKNTPALKNAKVNDTYEVEVSADEGSQFRRVAVDFLFRDAF